LGPGAAGRHCGPGRRGCGAAMGAGVGGWTWTSAGLGGCRAGAGLGGGKVWAFPMLRPVVPSGASGVRGRGMSGRMRSGSVERRGRPARLMPPEVGTEDGCSSHGQSVGQSLSLSVRAGEDAEAGEVEKWGRGRRGTPRGLGAGRGGGGGGPPRGGGGAGRGGDACNAMLRSTRAARSTSKRRLSRAGSWTRTVWGRRGGEGGAGEVARGGEPAERSRRVRRERSARERSGSCGGEMAGDVGRRREEREDGVGEVGRE
jgi:hypothetical protein